MKLRTALLAGAVLWTFGVAPVLAAQPDAGGPPAIYSTANGTKLLSQPVQAVGLENGNGATCLVGSDATCQLPGTGGSGSATTATPKGFVTVTTAALYTLAPPTGATTCYITAISATFNYRDDGVAPTAALGGGVPLAPGNQLKLSITNLAAWQAIPTSGTGTLDIDCYA